MTSSSSTVTAGEEGDDDIDKAHNAGDDGMQDVANAIDNCGQGMADGSEHRLYLGVERNK
jgi:hypothetical protein